MEMLPAVAERPTHRLVGCLVMLKCRMRRRSWLMMKKTIQHTKGDRRYGEEVHRDNRFAVIAKKSKPAFAWLWIWRRSFHPTGDRSLGNIETQHQKLPVDARCSPGWIFCDHAENQFPHFLRSKQAAMRGSKRQGTECQARGIIMSKAMRDGK
jgi:hypothetical protein